MAKRKTIQELEAAARAAEKRARELRQKAKLATEAERAKTNSEIIKALEFWLETFPEDKKKKWEELPDYFYKQAENNRNKVAHHVGTITRADIHEAFSKENVG